jgi:hypothetical protein
MTSEPVVRHFRQIALWPVQLMPVRTGPVQRHWELLDSMPDCAWTEVVDEFCEDPRAFQERHYREFVTFLPYAQRFLYGSAAGQESSRRSGEASIRTYRRRDVRAARITLERGGPAWTFRIAHADVHFFLDADVALVAFEMYADDLPLGVVQNTMFRFGRAYPGFWEKNGDGGNCPHSVEWLDADDRILASSDFADRSKTSSCRAPSRACPLRTGNSCSGHLCSSIPVKPRRCVTGSSSTTACHSWRISPSTTRNSSRAPTGCGSGS